MAVTLVPHWPRTDLNKFSRLSSVLTASFSRVQCGDDGARLEAVGEETIDISVDCDCFILVDLAVCLLSTDDPETKVKSRVKVNCLQIGHLN